MKLGTMILALIGRAMRNPDPLAAKSAVLEAVREQTLAHGLDHIELDDDMRWVHPAVFDGDLYSRLARLSADLGLAWTVHLPCVHTNLAAANEFVRRGSVAATLDSIDATAVLRPDRYVLHLIYEDPTDPASDWMLPIDSPWPLERSMRQAEASLRAILEKLPPEKLCIENLPEVPVDITTDLASRFDTSLCFDVGHLLRAGGDVFDFWRANRRRIGEVHLHDAVRDGEALLDHRPLGTGVAPIAELLDLVGAGDCWVTLEVFGWRQLQASMAYLHDRGLLRTKA